MVLKVILGLIGMGISYYSLTGSEIMFLLGSGFILVSLMIGDKSNPNINE